MALPRRSAGGHHILLWIGAAVAAVIAGLTLLVVARQLFQSWLP